jgi:hypothetical protein
MLHYLETVAPTEHHITLNRSAYDQVLNANPDSLYGCVSHSENKPC